MGTNITQQCPRAVLLKDRMFHSFGAKTWSSQVKSPERAARIRHALTAIRRGVSVRATSQQCGVSASAIQHVKQARERPSVNGGQKHGRSHQFAPPLRARLLAVVEAVEAAEATSVLRKAANVHHVSASTIQRAWKGQIASSGPGRHRCCSRSLAAPVDGLSRAPRVPRCSHGPATQRNARPKQV